jgi:hypothetical protein
MTDDTCGATKRDGSGDECQMPAGWGTDHVGEGRCKHHGGSGGAPDGEANGNYDHGGFSQALDDVADDNDRAIVRAFEEAADADNLDPVWMRLAGEAFMRYERSDDSRQLAECRRCLENAGDGDETVTLGDIEIAADFTDD